jgi:transposase-like protein
MRPARVYDRAAKLRAVGLAREVGFHTASRDLDIPRGVLLKWNQALYAEARTGQTVPLLDEPQNVMGRKFDVGGTFVSRHQKPDPEALRERDRTLAALDRMTGSAAITRAFFGDPPPGRSALDRRMAHGNPL